VIPTDKLAHRLALLKDADLSEDDLGSIAAELEDLERVMAELEEFAQATPWLSQQVQPFGTRPDHASR
jgi:hypothetical protein